MRERTVGDWAAYKFSSVDAVITHKANAVIITIVETGKITGALAVAVSYAFWRGVAVTEVMTKTICIDGRRNMG